MVTQAYLDKHVLRPPLISIDPDPSLRCCIVIPCHNERFILKTLESLESADANDLTFEVIVIVNDGFGSDAATKRQNRLTIEEIIDHKKCSCLSIHVVLIDDMPPKHAGVGLARKIGMDEACRRLPGDGLIVCLDADSTVASNYLNCLKSMAMDKKSDYAYSIYYEHDLNSVMGRELQAIVDYELHLRYYKNALSWTGHPHAFHTIGSAMAVKVEGYCKMGGMNQRKAGEDFYFLQKFAKVGKLKEINSTCVYPSSRSSNRVPFGTGKAVKDQLEGQPFLTSNIHSFTALKVFFEQLPQVYRETNWSIPDIIKPFLVKHNFELKLDEIRSNTTDYDGFRKRFLVWFDAFMVMKALHYMRDCGIEDVKVLDAANDFVNNLELRNLPMK